MIVKGYEIKACADLRGADLYGANLSGADLSGADLRGANLCDANLYGANLRRANLYGADLRRANLRGADLRRANLRDADLRGADLRRANLCDADLRDADLSDSKLPKFQITPKGYALYGFKKVSGSKVITLLIPAEANRTASLVGRKCRAEYVVVVDGEGVSKHDGKTEYKVGQTVYPDKYDPDIRVECTSGIHFFLTPEEAQEY